MTELTEEQKRYRLMRHALTCGVVALDYHCTLAGILPPRGVSVDAGRPMPRNTDPAQIASLDQARAEGAREERTKVLAECNALSVCDATGGAHSVWKQGRYRYCGDCGESLTQKKIDEAIRAAAIGGCTEHGGNEE